MPPDPTRRFSSGEPTSFRLEVQPETPTRPWHATLRLESTQSDKAPPLEFDSPLDLARHLANLGLEQHVRASLTRRGLR